MAQESEQKQPGQFAKRVKELGEELAELREALTIVANQAARTFPYMDGDSKRLEKLLEKKGGK
jgi:hypothetical protein